MATKNDDGECASKKKRKEDRTECIVEDVIQSLVYESIISEQEAVIIGFLGNHDVFVCLPTGFVKLLCYYCLPLMAERYTYCNSNSCESFDCTDQQSSKVPEKYKHTAISSCYTYTSNNSTHGKSCDFL